VLAVARHPVQDLELGPARGQRWIDVHRGKISLDRVGRVPQGDITMAALLIQAAEPG